MKVIDAATLTHAEIAARVNDYWPAIDADSPRAQLLQEASRRLNHLQGIEDGLYLYYLNGDIPASILAYLCGLHNEGVAQAVEKFCKSHNIKPELTPAGGYK